jgi:glycosyltransferase involved in cell wall biosynthesis
MARIRVLHVVEDLGLGGLEKVVFSICFGLDPARFEPSVWCLCDGGAIAERMSARGLTPKLLGMGPRPSIAFMRKLVGLLRQERFDIVHAHGPTANTVGRLAAVLARVPVVLPHCHSAFVDFSFKQRWLIRLLAPITPAVLCISQAVVDFAVESRFASRGRMVLLYNGVPSMLRLPPPGAKRNLGLPEEDSVILCVASMTPHKGHDYLLDAFALLLKKSPRSSLVLIGDGPLRPELEGQASRLGVAGKVLFAGSQDDITEFLSVSDLGVLASTASEGMSLWLAEAMSAGRPLVGTAVGGIPEVIAHGVNGLVVPARDARALADAMGRLLGDPALARTMGKASEDIYHEKFTLEGMISRLSGVYESLCHG